MRVSELCDEAGITVQRGGRDQCGYVYEVDEFHFGFEIGEHAMCFRYRTCCGSEGWFLHVCPSDPDSSLTFARIHEADVMQAILLYLWWKRELAQGGRPSRIPQQQTFRFVS
jgi:hypothetical protein